MKKTIKDIELSVRIDDAHRVYMSLLADKNYTPLPTVTLTDEERDASIEALIDTRRILRLTEEENKLLWSLVHNR